ncbi:MAG: hypothetical protein V7784_07705 [Oceanospirillaceae bacterium]
MSNNSHQYLHLHNVQTDNQAQRIKLLAGRALSEREFDLMQRYVDDRCDTLLSGEMAGIVEGLEISVDTHQSEGIEEQTRKPNIKLQAGVAIGRDGRAIRLLQPMLVSWQQLFENYQQSTLLSSTQAHPNQLIAENVIRGFNLPQSHEINPSSFTTDLNPRIGFPPSVSLRRPASPLSPFTATRISTGIRSGILSPTSASLFASRSRGFDTQILASQLQHFNQSVNASSVNGYFYITLQRGVLLLDEDNQNLACNRSELNPLRDSRIETVAKLNLAFISDSADLMSMSGLRASNKILATQASKASAANDVNIGISSNVNSAGLSDETDNGAIRLALIKIAAGELIEIDALAGRYLSEKHSAQQCFLRHYEHQLAQQLIPVSSDVNLSLAQNLGVDYLPSAATFPTQLLSQIAGSENSDKQWQTPILHFAPKDLQIELVPVPASTVKGTIQAEAGRGVVNLVHYQQARIRLMVAVDEYNYRPDLLSLAQIDEQLIQEVENRYALCQSDYNAWENQFKHLYKDLDRDLDQVASSKYYAEPITLFNSVFQVKGPSNSFAKLNAFAQRDKLNVPKPQAPPLTTTQSLNSLIDTRAQQLNNDQSLPRPYSLYRLEVPSFESVAIKTAKDNSTEPGLYRQRSDLQVEIAAIEADFKENYDVINEMNDFILVQRQHLDSISVSFATLAGGVPGDGSGLNLMRWAGSVNFNSDE